MWVKCQEGYTSLPSLRKEAKMSYVQRRVANTRSVPNIACDANMDPTELVKVSRAAIKAPMLESAPAALGVHEWPTFRFLLITFVVRESLKGKVKSVLLNEYFTLPHRAVKCEVTLQGREKDVADPAAYKPAQSQEVGGWERRGEGGEGGREEGESGKRTREATVGSEKRTQAS